MLSKAFSPCGSSSLNQDCCEADDLYLRRRFHNLILHRAEEAIFICDIVGCLRQHQVYRNGQIITSGGRIKIKTRGTRHKVKIKNVKDKDEGVYLLICRNPITNEKVYTHAALYIADIKRIEAPRIADYKTELERFIVQKQLISAAINEGETLRLNAEFSHRGHVFLFRNNKLVCDRKNLFYIEWSVKSATLAEAGIYSCVLFGSHGVLSSQCEIVVLPHNLKPHPLRYEEIHPDRVVVNPGEAIRLVSRCMFHLNGTIRWRFNDHNIGKDDRAVVRDLGGGYVSLTVRKTAVSDTGLYSLVVKDGETILYQSSCQVIVRELKTILDAHAIHFEWTPLPRTIRVRDPIPLLTYPGSRCILSCEFPVEDVWNYSVAWQVGQLAIRQETETCKMHSMRETHILQINSVTPEMNGEVTCEMTCLVPDGSNLDIRVARSYLTVLPATLDEQFCVSRNLRWVKGSIFPIRLQIPAMIGLTPDTCVTECYYDRDLLRERRDTVILFYFVRLEDDLCFMKIVHNENMTHDNIWLKFKKKNINNTVLGFIDFNWDVASMSWHYCLDTASRLCLQQDIWRPTGTISQRPSIRIENLPQGTFFLCRVMTAVPRLLDRRLRVKKFVINVSELPTYEERETEEVFNLQSLTREEYERDFTRVGPTRDIGRGGFGRLKLIRRNIDHKLFVQKEALPDPESMLQILNEKSIYELIKHPSISQAAYFVDDDNPVLIMEYLKGDNLDARIKARDQTEYGIKQYIRQICEALKYLHENDILHLDIKPDNIMLVHPNLHTVKLVDFGGAVVTSETGGRQRSGSKRYLAPEAYNRQKAGPHNDMWSVGVTTYKLLTAKYPFALDEVEFVKISNEIFDIPELNEMSRPARDFLRRLLRKKVKMRMTASEALEHEWLTDVPPTRNEGVRWQNRLKDIIRNSFFFCCNIASCNNYRMITDTLSACGDAFCIRLRVMRHNYRMQLRLRARAAAELNLFGAGASTSEAQRFILDKYIPRPSTPQNEDSIELNDPSREETQNNRMEQSNLNYHGGRSSKSQASRKQEFIELRDFTREGEIMDQIESERCDLDRYEEGPSSSQARPLLLKFQPHPSTSRNQEYIELKELPREVTKIERSKLDYYGGGPSTSRAQNSILRKYSPRPNKQLNREYMELREFTKEEAIINQREIERTEFNHYRNRPTTLSLPQRLSKPRRPEYLELRDFTREEAIMELLEIDQSEMDLYDSEESPSLQEEHPFLLKCTSRPSPSREEEWIQLRDLTRKETKTDWVQSERSEFDHYGEGPSTSQERRPILQESEPHNREYIELRDFTRQLAMMEQIESIKSELDHYDEEISPTQARSLLLKCTPRSSKPQKPEYIELRELTREVAIIEQIERERCESDRSGSDYGEGPSTSQTRQSDL